MKRKIKKLSAEALDSETALTVPTDSANAQTTGGENRLTIYEYEQKYTKRQNLRGAKLCLRLIIAVMAILLFICMFFFTMKIVDLYLYAGIGVGVVCLILYICL